MTRALRIAAALLVPAGAAAGYPLDAWRDTGIDRLEAYRRVQEGEMPGRLLPLGAQLPGERIELQLGGRPGFALPAPDPEFTAAVKRLLPEDADAYGIAVLDLTDPERPRLATHRAGAIQNPGSVGKIMVALGWFQALADLYPDDVEARERLLRETRVTADEFIVHDHHVVPFWEPGDARYRKRAIRQGDTANLYTWLDWMLSSSSNAAAATLQAQLLLLVHHGRDYPVTPEAAERFFRETPRAELRDLHRRAMIEPIERNGLDPEALRQGSFFTRTGKRRVPGTNSVATPRELLRYAVRMEQGRLVDRWSSLEIKRFLYLTDRRIRYASAPALYDFAVYFKSGSLYSCQPEPGFECKKYHGNVRNYMNSLTVVEDADARPGLHYMAVVLSNVLRMNSAVIHQTLATRLHRLIVKMHPEVEPPPGPAPLPDLSPGSPGDGATTSRR